MTDIESLVSKLLSEGAKEFPHQWPLPITPTGGVSCLTCGTLANSKLAGYECPVLLRAALDLTLKERDAALRILDTHVEKCGLFDELGSTYV